MRDMPLGHVAAAAGAMWLDVILAAAVMCCAHKAHSNLLKSGSPLIGSAGRSGARGGAADGVV